MSDKKATATSNSSVRPALVKLSGKSLSPGMASGKACVYRDALTHLDEFYDIGEADVPEEVNRFASAVSTVCDELGALANRVSEELTSDLSDVFHAHAAMLQDASLNAEVEKEIGEVLVSAGTAVKTVFRRWERRFSSMDAEVARHKADDIRDLARRLISSLAGVRAHSLEDLPADSVLVAHRLLPSDTIFLARRKASAALLEFGGAGSHAALFAREIGLPCIAGLPGLMQKVPDATRVLVDADAAEAILNPDPEREKAFQAKRRRRAKARTQARARAREPAVTKDGVAIAVLANVACADDTREAMDDGADGVGLYRIEQAFLGRQTPPDADDLYKEILGTLKSSGDLPVYVRLLDIGADKPLPYMEPPRERNPALGKRGIRFLRDYPDLLDTQLQALLKLSPALRLRIIVPMVTLPHDMESVKERLAELAKRCRIAPVPELGAMIETPAAALSMGQIAQHAAFVSFGTNDLTQYTLAADRENEAVEQYYDDTHDAIFRLLDIAHRDAPKIPVSVCGELAGRPDCVARLLQCGVRSLSVAPPMVPEVKEAVRDCCVRAS